MISKYFILSVDPFILHVYCKCLSARGDIKISSTFSTMLSKYLEYITNFRYALLIICITFYNKTSIFFTLNNLLLEVCTTQVQL